MNKKIQFVFNVIAIIITTFAYSALSTSLAIVSDVKIRPHADIRVTRIKPMAGSDGQLTYEPDFTMDTITTGFTLPTPESTFTYEVTVANNGDIDYIIYDSFISSTNNPEITYSTTYIEEEQIKTNISDHIIGQGDTFTFNVTFTGATGESNIITEFDFRKIHYIVFDLQGGDPPSVVPNPYSNVYKIEDVDLVLPSAVPTKEGYEFDGWKKSTDSSDGTIYPAGATFDFNPTGRTYILYAHYIKTSHMVYYDTTKNGGSGDIPPISVEYGEYIDLTPTPDGGSDGWQFIGWTTDDSENATQSLITLKMGSSDITLYAIYMKEAQTFVARWDAIGVTLSSTEQSSCNIPPAYNHQEQGLSCTVIAPTIKDGSSNTPEFLGFNTEDDLTHNNASFDKTTGKLTLTASNTNNTWYLITYKPKQELTANWDSRYITSTEPSKCELPATYNGTPQLTSCTVTAPTINPPTGYSKVGFNTDSTASTSSSSYNSSDNTITLTNSNKDQIWYAIVKANTYKIKYTMNGGSDPSTKPTTGTYDQNVTISNPTKTVIVEVKDNGTGATIIGNPTSKNQTFAGWSSTSIGNNAKTGANTSSYVTWDGTTATTNRYFRNLKDNNNETVTMVANWNPVSVSLPSVSKNGYTCGVYTSQIPSDETKVTGSYLPSANSPSVITLYASCSAIDYTLTLDPNGGTYTGTTSKTMTYDSSNNNNIGVPSKVGYTFDGWYTAKTNGAQVFDSTGENVANPTYWSAAYPNGVWSYTSNSTVYAKYTARSDTKYTVYHYTKNVGSNSYSLYETDDLTGTSDSSLTVSTLKKTIEGFTYSAGYLSGGTTKPSSGAVTSTTILPDGSREIYLYYTRDKYTVSLTSSEGISSVSGAGTYEYGASVTITANPSSGYKFKNWTVGSDETVFTTANPYTFTMERSNLEYTANGEIETYTIDYDLDGGTLSTPNPTSYNINQSFIINNPTKEGYSFTGWTGSNGNKPNTNIYIMRGDTGNKTYTANWTPLTITATFYNGNTFCFRKSMTYNSSDNNSVATVSKAGYVFTGWYTSSSGGTKVFDSAGKNVANQTYWSAAYPNGVWKYISSNTLLFAQFSDSTYQIDFDSNPPLIPGSTTEHEQVDGTMTSQSAGYGTSEALTPNGYSISGYTFTGWNTSADGTGTSYLDGANAPTEATTLYAQWAINNVTVGLAKDGSSYNNSGMKVALYLDGVEKFSTTVSSGSTATFTKVPLNATGKHYDIYVSKDSNHKNTLVDSGVDLVVDSPLESETINYYTLTVNSPNSSTKVNDTTISNNDSVILVGGSTTATSNYPHVIESIPNAGYEFVNNATIWSIGSGTSIIGDYKETPTTIRVNSPTTIISTSTPKIYSITFNNQGASSPGTSIAYYKYNTSNNGCYYYSDSTLETCLTDGNKIVNPIKTGYSYYGYYANSNGTGTQYVNTSGAILNNIYQKRPEEIDSNFTNQITLYAKWVDNNPPSTPNAYAIRHSDGSSYTSGTWTNEQIDTIASSTDSGSGIASILYKYSSSWIEGTLIHQGNSYYIQNEWTPVDGSEITVKFKAVDASNNESSESNSINIKYDLSGPTITTDAVNDTISYDESIEITLADSYSGIVAYQINQSSTQTSSGWTNITSTSSYSITRSNLTMGTYYIWAKDAAGNISSKAITVDKSAPIIILSSSYGSSYVGDSITFNAQSNMEGVFSVVSGNTTYATASVSSEIIPKETNTLITVNGISTNGTDSANTNITVNFTPTDPNYRQGSSLYNFTVVPYSSTVYFNANTDSSATSPNELSVPTGCTKDNNTNMVTCTCTSSDSSTSCNITSPTISNSTTPNVLGFSTSSSSGSSSGKWDHNTSKSFNQGVGGTYYAQTNNPTIDGKVTFDPNGNTRFTYNSTNYTSATAIKICTIAATYNGVSQQSTCSATINMPTITANSNTPSLIGWSTGATNRSPSYTSGETGVIITSGSTYYAQTTKAEVTLTAKWNANNATLASTANKTCKLAATYNGTAQSGSCTVDAPSVSATPSNTPTFVGFNTTSGATSNNSSYNKSTNKLTLTTSNNNNTWYVITTKAKVTLTAKWNKNTASSLSSTSDLTCDLAATYNGTAQANSCTVTAPSITAKTGYHVIGYNTTSGATTNNSSYNTSTRKLTLTSSNNNKTWYAITAVNKYNISYNLNSGSYGNLHPTEAYYDSTVAINNPTRSGFSFTGWKASGDFTSSSAYYSADGSSFDKWNGRDTTYSYYKNLTTKNGGTVTLTATWIKAPVITGGTGTSWIDHNQLIWISTDGAATRGVDHYEYCINTSNTASGCSWKPLSPTMDGSYSDIFDYYDPAVYQQQNSDLLSAYSGDVTKLTNHFRTSGINNYRMTTEIFNVSTYKENNSDLSNAFGNTPSSYFNHFKNTGINEERITSNYVNVKNYKNKYSDLSAFGNNLALYYRHMMKYGIGENRDLGGTSKYVRKTHEINTHGLRYIFFRTISKGSNAEEIHHSAASNSQATKIGVKSADPVCGTDTSATSCTSATCCGQTSYTYWSTCKKVGETAQWCANKGGSMNCPTGSNCTCYYSCQQTGYKPNTCTSACCGTTTTYKTCWHE